MILETEEEIHQWLKEQCPAFVRYVGDNLSSLCDHFLQRINEGTGGLADLTHLSHRRRIVFSHVTFKGYRIKRFIGSVRVFWPLVIRDSRFNETEPLPEYDLKQKKLELHSHCSERFERFALCFFRYLIVVRFPDREHLIAPLRRIYFNEGKYAVWVRMIEKKYAPDFVKTFPKSDKVDHAFSSAENLEAAKAKGLDLRDENGVAHVFWQGNVIPEFDGIFSIPIK